jgi:fructuronate reductase
MLHLGLGNFFRAHQAWYTERAPDADDWGIAAFTGRRRDLADSLQSQDTLYTLVTRAADRDCFDVIGSVSAAHAAAEHETWLRYVASEEVGVVTLTVTEAAYLRAPAGGLDVDRPELQADLSALRTELTAPVSTVPARLVAGLVARRAAGGGPITLVPCDNLPDNAGVVMDVLTDLAQILDPNLREWIDSNVAAVTTMVDRITPRTSEEDRRAVAAATGLDDRAPVATEPFSEWVLSGTFAAGRPNWEAAGATFTDDVTPFEQRKLWLLNGAHSLLAYAGSVRGHQTVADAVADDTCRGWLEQWWAEASEHLDQPPAELMAYRSALADRFANPRMMHRLDQIAVDGSQKVPVRVLPTVRAERAAGRSGEGGARVLAAWLCHLRGVGAPVDDARADELVPLAAGPLAAAVRRVADVLDSELAADEELLHLVQRQAEELSRT